MRTLGGNVPIGSNVRSPRFRRDPFVRDMVFDHGRASAPRITGPHMLPSTLLTVSASAISWFSRLNSTPHTITVYASQPPSPATTQHSLPGARYSLPGPDFHRQDHASSCLAHKQSILPFCCSMDCFARNDVVRAVPHFLAAKWLLLPVSFPHLRLDLRHP